MEALGVGNTLVVVVVVVSIVGPLGLTYVRTFQVQEQLGTFDNCANCLNLAMEGDTNVLLSMCADLARNKYSSFYEDNEALFSDGLLGPQGTITYKQGLGILTFVFTFIVLGMISFVMAGNSKHTLPPKLFMYGFIWNLMCLVFILDLSGASEETFNEMGTCWVLNIDLVKKEMNSSLTRWMWASLAVFAGIMLGCSALACRCNPKKNLSAFFFTTGLFIFIPGFFGLCYLFMIVWEINTLELWCLFAWNVIMIGATAFYTFRIRNDDTHASDVGVVVNYTAHAV